MQNPIYIWKSVGLTPFDIVNEFKGKFPEYKNETISYAGRLDPMAEGILVLLIGDDNKNREKYLELDKVYESEIVFGISTDSYDGLGKIVSLNIDCKPATIKIKKALANFIGERNQEYPPYSSKAVDGKPLFWWARKNKLSEIKIPIREINIYSIQLLDFEKVSVEKLVNNIMNNVRKVNGDFRQEEIIKGWGEFIIEIKNKNLIKIKIRVHCSSGTYIRSIANQLGKALDASSFAYSIKRIAVGDIREKDCIKLNIK